MYIMLHFTNKDRRTFICTGRNRKIVPLCIFNPPWKSIVWLCQYFP